MAGLITILFLVSIYQIPAVHALMGNEEVGPGTSVAGQALQQPFANGNGLTEWYNFDGTTNDSSVTANNATITGTTHYGAGKFNKAFLFDGSTYLSPGSLMIPSAATTWSFSTWIYPTSFPNNPILFQELGSGGGVLEVYDSGGSGGTNKSINLDIFNGSWTRLTSTTAPIVLNQWNLVTVTYNSTTAIIYINGVSDGSSTLNTIPTLSGGSVSLGGGASNADFAGSIDDMRFYNRVLSQSEITNLYQGSTPVNCDQSCVGWWKLDDGIANNASTSAIDSSGNGYTGTLHSFTYDILTNGWGSGVFGGGVQLSGATQYITTSALPTTSTMTVSAWVNPSSSFAAYARIFGTTVNGPALGMNSNATIDYSIVNSGGTYSDFTGPSVKLGSWSNITMTLSGFVLKIYLNGVLVGTSNTSFALSSSTFANGIGSLPTSGGQAFNGLLDDVRLYNRALRDYEVAAIYNAGRSS